MKSIHRILLGLAVGALGACSSSSPYVYDPYYGYSTVAYDDYYYDSSMVGGYYYYPSVYYYGYQTMAASSVSVVPPAVRLLLERLGAPIEPTCLTATTTADVDRDGIDANSTITFACNSTPSGGTAQVTGSVTVQDLDDNVPDAGYTVKFNGLDVRVVSSTGALTARVVDGTETIQKVAGGVRIIRDVVVSATDTFPDTIARTSKLAMKSQGLFTPEIADGSALVTKGTLVLSGTGDFTGPDGVATTITRTTDPSLHWNNDCTKVAGSTGAIDGGAIVYRSSRGRETRIVHESCTAKTVTNAVVPVP